MTLTRKWVGLCMMAIVALAGCASTADHLDRLDQTLRSYSKAVRWARFDLVYSFYRWPAGETPELPAHLKDIRVTGYESAGVVPEPDGRGALQVVTIRYYTPIESRERTIEDRQRWEMDPTTQRWQLVTRPPDFR